METTKEPLQLQNASVCVCLRLAGDGEGALINNLAEMSDWAQQDGPLLFCHVSCLYG